VTSLPSIIITFSQRQQDSHAISNYNRLPLSFYHRLLPQSIQLPPPTPIAPTLLLTHTSTTRTNTSRNLQSLPRAPLHSNTHNHLSFDHSTHHTNNVLDAKNNNPPRPNPRLLPHNLAHRILPARTTHLQSRPPAPLHPAHVRGALPQRKLRPRCPRRHERRPRPRRPRG
jgi:hypothetical protein